MRFLLIPPLATAYDQRMMAGLGRGLRQIGHDVAVMEQPLAAADAAARCRELCAEVVIEINRLRSASSELPGGVRHVAWFQDVFTGSFDEARERIRSDDLVYTLGAPEDLGLTAALPCRVDCLFTGVDDEIIAKTRVGAQDLDFSLCGFLRPPFPRLSAGVEFLLRLANGVFDLVASPASSIALPIPHEESVALRNTIAQHYRPLRGELDIHALAAAVSPISEIYIEKGSVPLPRFIQAKGRAQRRRTIERYISSLVREYPRMLDRIALVDAALAVSRSLALYGTGWDGHPRFRPYFHGDLTTLEQLIDVYRRTRVNLANNTHGLGLHSRTLECMAVGGFIFMHASARDGKPGGMHTSFEPGVHYGMYTPETLQDDARYWLREENKRRDAGLRAAGIIRDRHLWRHRAEQIVRDLTA